MKITSVECYLGDKGLGGFVTVKVNTDEGISGFGAVSYTHLDVYKRQAQNL